MLFVSKKEPLTNTKTLPDTSLHNVRKHQESSNACCSDCSSSSLFESSQACLPKLTKEQFTLHREFLRLGSLLMAENINLFHNALTTLSAKHDLKTVTPATCVSDIVPPTQIPRHRSEVADFAAPRPSNCKYTLPKEVAEKEFYQCMLCKERRATNSFGSAHTHAESAKSCIRWYCPLCDKFFAVTHRGYHVKSRHSDVLTIAHSEPVAEAESSPVVDSVSLKRPQSERSSDEEQSEFAPLTPPEKLRHTVSPSPSAVSVESSVESTCYPNCDLFEEEGSLSVSALTFPYHTEEQDTQLFNEGDNEPFLPFSSSSVASFSY